jgi:hypothetical protein
MKRQELWERVFTFQDCFQYLNRFEYISCSIHVIAQRKYQIPRRYRVCLLDTPKTSRKKSYG